MSETPPAARETRRSLSRAREAAAAAPMSGTLVRREIDGDKPHHQSGAVAFFMILLGPFMPFMRKLLPHDGRANQTLW